MIFFFTVKLFAKKRVKQIKGFFCKKADS